MKRERNLNKTMATLCNLLISRMRILADTNIKSADRELRYCIYYASTMVKSKSLEVGVKNQLSSFGSFLYCFLVCEIASL